MRSDATGPLETRSLWRFLAGDLRPLWTRLLEGAVAAPTDTAEIGRASCRERVL